MASTLFQKKAFRARFCQLLSGAQVTKDDYFNRPSLQYAMEEGLLELILDKTLAADDMLLAAEMRQSIERNLREMAARQMRLRHACARILAHLREAKVPVVCMRGLAISQRYYGDEATLRPVSDIDLLLEKRHMMEAKQLLWDIGFRPDPVHRHIYVRGDIVLDLHYEPLGYERIDAWRHLTSLRAEAFFERAETGLLLGEEALLLPPALDLPYLCFHALKHSFERLIWLYDIALLARTVDANDGWEDVRASIQEYGLERPCYYSLAYVRAHLGAPVPEELLAAIKPSMGWVERSLFGRFMRHEQVPYLAERLFSRMQPDFAHRIAFWRETIYPRYEVRQEIAGSGCVKCNFTRKRLKQLLEGGWQLMRDLLSLRPLGKGPF